MAEIYTHPALRAPLPRGDLLVGELDSITYGRLRQRSDEILQVCIVFGTI
jgi:hypothetical protein